MIFKRFEVLGNSPEGEVWVHVEMYPMAGHGLAAKRIVRWQEVQKCLAERGVVVDKCLSGGVVANHNPTLLSNVFKFSALPKFDKTHMCVVDFNTSTAISGEIIKRRPRMIRKPQEQ